MPLNSNESILDHYQAMELAVSQLLIEKGYFTESDMFAEIEAMAKRTSEIGAKVVARAWANEEFREALLVDGTEACESIGIVMGPTRMMVVESTEKVHNDIVSTL